MAEKGKLDTEFGENSSLKTEVSCPESHISIFTKSLEKENRMKTLNQEAHLKILYQNLETGESYSW